MRKVLYKSWNVDTKKWDDDFIHPGIFHKWGFSFEEFESNAVNFSVAIIEREDGVIEEVLPQNVKFILSQYQLD